MLSNKELRKKAKKIRYFFADVDGTLTDGRTYYSISGEAMKSFSHLDGTGFFLLKQAGITAGILTGELTEIVRRRAEKLNVNLCFLGVQNKYDFIVKYALDQKLGLDEIAYIGDDLNDLQLVSHVGISFATNNAHVLIKRAADISCSKSGGFGAFREAVEILLGLQDKDIYETFCGKC
jgi:YrbI family 3-deoxy-D-manno-octulosonate 8-phosphate phosphatase